MGHDEGDCRALLGWSAEVSRVGVVWDTKDPRRDEELSRTAGWHEERVRSRTVGTGADAEGRRGPGQACGDHGVRRVVGGVDCASQRGRGRVKASRGQACGCSGEAKTTPRRELSC